MSGRNEKININFYTSNFNKYNLTFQPLQIKQLANYETSFISIFNGY